MYPHKLKAHIGATLFGLLFFAMILINLVIFVFWYQHMIHEAAVKVKETVKAWTDDVMPSNGGRNSSEFKDELVVLLARLGPDCKQVFLVYHQNIVSAVDDKDHWDLLPLIRASIITPDKTVYKLDRVDVPFLFAPKILAVISPIKDQNTAVGGVGVVVDTSGLILRLFEKEKIIIVYIFFNGIILATIGFFRMRNVLLKPMNKLVTVAENYQLSEGAGLFGDHRENEFGQLSRAMGAMVQRIEEDREKLFDTLASLEETNRRLQEAQQEVIHAEKLAAAGRLSASLAHEIGNPLAIIQGYLELLQDGNLSEEDRLQFSGRSLEELQRIDKLLRQLMDMTRSREQKPGVVAPYVVVSQILDVLRASLNKKNIFVSFSSTEKKAAIWGDEELLRQVLLNCLLNAIDAVFVKMHGAEGGEIKVALSVIEKDGDMLVLLTVSDNGLGIKKEHLSYIFEPFFTGKAPGKGTGLGLAVSYRIIQSLGGKIEVESEWGEGSNFRILLPLYDGKNDRGGGR